VSAGGRRAGCSLDLFTGAPAGFCFRLNTASVLVGNRVVFNVKGNRYRLVVAVRYDLGIFFIRFVGTHREYDAVDASTV
jgi:mRNA interferase HigB